MLTQTQPIPVRLCEFAFALPIAEPICADSRDYGFDVDEEEIGRELLAPSPVEFANQSLPEVEADEFEERFAWFVS